MAGAGALPVTNPRHCTSASVRGRSEPEIVAPGSWPVLVASIRGAEDVASDSGGARPLDHRGASVSSFSGVSCTSAPRSWSSPSGTMSGIARRLERGAAASSVRPSLGEVAVYARRLEGAEAGSGEHGGDGVSGMKSMLEYDLRGSSSVSPCGAIEPRTEEGRAVLHIACSANMSVEGATASGSLARFAKKPRRPAFAARCRPRERAPPTQFIGAGHGGTRADRDGAGGV